MCANTSQPTGIVARRANDPRLVFTNPLLTCSITENKKFNEIIPFEKTVASLISKIDPQKQNIVSMYYRDLNSGQWFSINDTETYSPASLFKVPVMIAYLKETETDPSLLTKKIFYDGKDGNYNTLEYYKPGSEIKSGHYYTIDELITSMIKYSDNDAAVLLSNSMDTRAFSEVLADIGLHLPNADDLISNNGNYITVKSYSYLFRLLYNSTYLSRTISEKALKLLSDVEFNKGIVSGIPKGILSAQKFGEKTVTNQNGTTYKELHDCGIIYYTDHPYLLCIMTKGKDIETLSSIIKTISEAVYQGVDSRYTNKK